MKDYYNYFAEGEYFLILSSIHINFSIKDLLIGQFMNCFPKYFGTTLVMVSYTVILRFLPVHL